MPGTTPRPTSQNPPYFDGLSQDLTPGRSQDIVEARVLAIFGDKITTDHISPAGSTSSKASPAGAYLTRTTTSRHCRLQLSYGARRGNHEVMMRGTFANIRIRNRMHARTIGRRRDQALPVERANESIFDAAMRVQEPKAVPLVIIAGKEYGTGSSRDWAAKGTTLLGVRAVIAQSPSSASTARTWSAWAWCRCSSSRTAGRSWG